MFCVITLQYRCDDCVCAESPLFNVLPTDKCGGGGCCDDDGRINSIGTPVYGDFTTSSYFGGKSFAAMK